MFYNYCIALILETREHVPYIIADTLACTSYQYHTNEDYTITKLDSTSAFLSDPYIRRMDHQFTLVQHRRQMTSLAWLLPLTVRHNVLLHGASHVFQRDRSILDKHRSLMVLTLIYVFNQFKRTSSTQPLQQKNVCDIFHRGLQSHRTKYRNHTPSPYLCFNYEQRL